MKNKVKKGDTVRVITGDYKGDKGRVIEILPKKGKVKVEGVCVVVRNKKARAQGQQSGRISQEAFIDISNVAPAGKVRAARKKSKDQE